MCAGKTICQSDVLDDQTIKIESFGVDSVLQHITGFQYLLQFHAHQLRAISHVLVGRLEICAYTGSRLWINATSKQMGHASMQALCNCKSAETTHGNVHLTVISTFSIQTMYRPCNTQAGECSLSMMLPVGMVIVNLSILL